MMIHEIGETNDGDAVSPDYLWWPRLKVAGRYLSAWLTGTEPQEDLSPREMPIEVEASWPHWGTAWCSELRRCPEPHHRGA